MVRVRTGAGVMAPGSSDDQLELGNGPCVDWGRCYGAWKQ